MKQDDYEKNGVLMGSFASHVRGWQKGKEGRDGKFSWNYMPSSIRALERRAERGREIAYQYVEELPREFSYVTSDMYFMNGSDLYVVMPVGNNPNMSNVGKDLFGKLEKYGADKKTGGLKLSPVEAEKLISGGEEGDVYFISGSCCDEKGNSGYYDFLDKRLAKVLFRSMGDMGDGNSELLSDVCYDGFKDFMRRNEFDEGLDVGLNISKENVLRPFSWSVDPNNRRLGTGRFDSDNLLIYELERGLLQLRDPKRCKVKAGCIGAPVRRTVPRFMRR